MRRHTAWALGALLGLAPSVIAWRPIGDSLTLQPDSRLWFDGNSTVRRWSCKAGSFETVVDAAPDAVAGVLAAQKVVRAATVRVPSRELACGNGVMDEHMLKALRAETHPVIEFRLASYEVARGGDGVQGTLTGTLTLAGVSRTISIPAQARPGDDGVLRVTGAYPLAMPDFGMKPPTLMLGTLKVDPTVTVRFDLALKG
jgi:hypothetical protein